ncbi:MAG TPA: glycogen debranching enzyme GlgX, partial [Burkholderiaceae bacterium]|nr:glycogen debranching enzyme GlgX [Burkholderiaceae bacterium]
NAYCQDNETSWVNWQLSKAQQEFGDFVVGVLRLRRDHPTFRRRSFFQGRRIMGSGVKDILWLKPDGTEMSDEEWNDSFARCLGMFLPSEGMEERDFQGARLRDDSFLLLFNAHYEPVPFTLPQAPGAHEWEVLLDTAQENVVQAPVRAGAVYPAKSRSLVLLRPSGAGSGPALAG